MYIVVHHHHNKIHRLFSSPQKVPLTQSSTSLISILMVGDFYTHKWYHAFVSDFFLHTQWLWNLSTLDQESVLHSLLFLGSIPLYGNTAIYLSIFFFVQAYIFTSVG